MLQNRVRSRQLLAAALVIWLFAAGRMGAGEVDPLARKVSVRHVAVPLSTILPTLEGEDLLLHLGPEFAETKASLIIRDRSLREVLDRIAQVYGAEWKPIGKVPLQLSLRRTRPVTEWLKAWKETREEAELRARAIQEARVRRGLSEAFAALDEPLPTDSQGR